MITPTKRARDDARGKQLLDLGMPSPLPAAPPPAAADSTASTMELRDEGLVVDYYQRFVDERTASNLLSGLTKPKGEGGEGLGVIGPRRGLHESFCAGMGEGERLWDSDEASPTLREVWLLAERIKEHLGLDASFDYAVIQVYKAEGTYRKGIRPHTDSEQHRDMPIVGLSLFPDPAQQRPLTTSLPGKASQDVELHHGSIYVLRPPTNDKWKHSLKERKQTRVSITFRHRLTEMASLPGGATRVESENVPGKWYDVTPTSCTCPAFARNTRSGKPCKHMKAAFGA